jgi:hypothetical protein
MTVSGKRQFTMGHRANLSPPLPGWIITRFEGGKRFMRCMTINDDDIQCMWEIRFTSWPKPCRHDFQLQQLVMRHRDIDRWLETYLFGLLEVSLQAVEQTSIQRLLNAFLDFRREDEHFQLNPIIIPDNDHNEPNPN